ncbi:DEAD/DEAH box helicase [Mangrovicella endophytica]|uniref:DEAD/DEAH box helicase n=1 Tax=Mangrovicella endophytica TaxID=2066697 RepID=UPI000C9DCC80|nr:DEAD/DEAH box helicase [Mangrovicella endophytica]
MPFSLTSPALAKALAERDYSQPTPVQAAVLAPETAGRDLLVSAQTGSGKTVAYGLAMAPTLLGDAETLPAAREPLALVVAPTRELALQVQRELFWLYAHTGARIVTCVGGMDPRAEQKRLAEGAHIVVGTPGRLRDHLERGRLLIGNLKALVLDEADEMLDLGFREDLEFILEATPAERRTLLFSATLPDAIRGMTKRYQKDALRIEAGRGSTGHADIEYRAIRVVPKEIEHAVVNLLRFIDAPSAIIFCNTREAVRHLYSGLLERGFSAVSLSGELGQAERNQAMQALRDGRARVCVATDVAARGIDLPSLGLVIHADLPHDAETLQHRSGRTGRAGRKGVSVLLVPISRRRKADRLLTEARIQASWGAAPSADDIRQQDEERLLADPIFAEAGSEEDLAVARRLLETYSAEQLAAALVKGYRERLPAPEEVYDPGFARDTKGAEGFGERDRKNRKEHDGDKRVSGPKVWFHLDVGRRNNADPKWLLPLLCRRGQVSRAEIGAIRIFDSETKVEIAAEAAERFAQAADRDGGDDITITQLSEGGAPGKETRRDGPAHARGKKPFRKGPHAGPAGKPGDKAAAKFDKPRRPKPKKA